MTLKELFTNIANAIRSATGTTGKIKASDFAKKINDIKYRGVAVEGTDSGENAHGVYYHIPSGYYNEDGTNSWVYRPLSDFGNAKASDVLSGKTFTSISGKEVKGTMTNNFVISHASLIFRGGNGEGHATSYRTTTHYDNLLVSYARGELQISGNYGNRINLGNVIEAGTAIRDLAIFTNVSAGTTFTNPTFNASVTNGGLIIYALS